MFASNGETTAPAEWLPSSPTESLLQVLHEDAYFRWKAGGRAYRGRVDRWVGFAKLLVIQVQNINNQSNDDNFAIEPRANASHPKEVAAMIEQAAAGKSESAKGVF